MIKKIVRFFSREKEVVLEPVKPVVKPIPRVDGWILVNGRLNLYDRNKTLLATMPEELLDTIAAKPRLGPLE